MSQMAARYDLRARSYGRCWAPVLAPSALTLLEVVEPVVGAAPAARLLDAGTGSGTLAMAATRRWPLVRVIGLDVSAGMLVPVSYTHLRAHETPEHLVCRLLL